MNKFLKVFILTVLYYSFSFSFVVSPMNIELTPYGSGRNHYFKVFNSEKEPIAVEITFQKRFIDKFGKEQNTDDFKNIMLYPPQIVVPPKTEKKIRVVWVGNKNIKEEKAYRFTFKQLPINLTKINTKDLKASIDIKFVFSPALYVVPDNAKYNLNLEDIKTTDKNLSITIKNSGNKHKIIKKAYLEIKNNNETTTVDLEKLIGNNILANGLRIFDIEIPENIKNLTINKDNSKIILE